MFRAFIFTGLLSLFFGPALAKPQVYNFDYSASQINFTYDYNGESVKGKFPKFEGNLLLDFQNVSNSIINVSINTARAQGGFVFATSALRGPKILFAKKFPVINFKSQSASLKDGVAVIKGQITVRNITRPITLTARFFNLTGKDPKERDDLAVKISGTINRHDFGASGYRDMVGETLAINIMARIERQ